MASLILVIKDGVGFAQCLHENEWSEGGAVVVKVVHQALAGRGQEEIILTTKSLRLFLRILAWIEFLESIPKLVDSFEALNHRVHVACVSQVFKAGWNNDDRLCRLRNPCNLRCRHILNELNRLLRLLKRLAFGCAHHHDCHAVSNVELG